MCSISNEKQCPAIIKKQWGNAVLGYPGLQNCDIHKRSNFSNDNLNQVTVDVRDISDL